MEQPPLDDRPGGAADGERGENQPRPPVRAEVPAHHHHHADRHQPGLGAGEQDAGQQASYHRDREHRPVSTAQVVDEPAESAWGINVVGHPAQSKLTAFCRYIELATAQAGRPLIGMPGREFLVAETAQAGSHWIAFSICSMVLSIASSRWVSVSAVTTQVATKSPTCVRRIGRR